MEFEVGKWYSIKTSYNWIIKFKGLNNDRLEASWCCINKPNKKVEKGGVWDSKPTEIKELSLEEIQQYLPDGHPDKISLFPKDSSHNKILLRLISRINGFYRREMV